ncbi:MAG TPA: IPTL-CTERM sorting domain-containing protein, partial [Thermoanaerobaculia bacterium]
PAGTTITNQGTISYDANGDGTNESTAATDASPGGAADPTSFQVAGPAPAPIPTLDGLGLMLLALLLAVAGGWALRRRRAA